jgi:hypothetical protein
MKISSPSHPDIAIELSDETMLALECAAATWGVTPQEYARRVLRNHLATDARDTLPPNFSEGGMAS